jgi:signal peptidase I
LVQSELHPADEGREVDGNSGQPNADAQAQGVPEAVSERSPEQLALPAEPERPLERLAPTTEPERSLESAADVARAFQPSEAIAVDAPPDLRLTSPGIRLAQVKEELVAWVKTLVSAAVYAILIVTFGFQIARVEGQSMAPTLEDQDRLVVNKLVYRIGEPRRGDIVMLYYPLNPEKSFVKRVIAEEGDTVRIVDGRVYVNDIPLKDDYVPNEFRSHDDWGPQVIPEGYYFVMGDHRNNSSDSRHWGMVPKKYIIGKVQLRWWPVPNARMF